MTSAAHGRRIVEALPASTRDALRRSPLNAMRALGLTVTPVAALASSRGGGGICDGMSFSRHGTVLYAPTDSRRENFTLLHEYAHILINADEDAIVWLADRPDPGAELEKLCDQIAALLLVPDEVLDALIGRGPIQGGHVLELYRTTEASQMVCAIAVARRLPCAGAVILTDRQSARVVHASIVGELAVYPRPGQATPDNHPLSRLSAGEHLTRRSFWATPWGDRRSFYLSAMASTRRTYAVLAESDMWGIERLHIAEPSPAPPERATRDVRCPCGYSGVTTNLPCPDCDRPFCSKCSSCDCERRRKLARRCSQCFTEVAAADISNGLCSFCG